MQNIRNGRVFCKLPALCPSRCKKAGFSLLARAILLRLLSFRKDKGYKTSCELKEEIDKAMETAKRHALTYLRQMTEANFTVLPFQP
jgi:hypothetical protein